MHQNRSKINDAPLHRPPAAEAATEVGADPADEIEYHAGRLIVWVCSMLFASVTIAAFVAWVIS